MLAVAIIMQARAARMGRGLRRDPAARVRDVLSPDPALTEA
jgi:hypothetical protein